MSIPTVWTPQTTPPEVTYSTNAPKNAPYTPVGTEVKFKDPAPVDDKVEVTYTDPSEQFIEELKEKLGLLTDDELRAQEA